MFIRNSATALRASRTFQISKLQQRSFNTRIGQEKMEPVLTRKHGTDLLNDPLVNKGTAWPMEVQLML